MSDLLRRQSQRALAIALLAIVFLTGALVVGCGSGDDSPTEPETPSGSNIGGTWAAVGDPSHTFAFVCPTCPAATAEFDGEEVRGGVTYSFFGEFEDGIISFVSLDPFNPTAFRAYGGLMFGDDAMELTTDTGVEVRIERVP